MFGHLSYEPVEWQDPPLCKAQKTSQTISQCNTELVRQQTLKLAFCDLLKRYFNGPISPLLKYLVGQGNIISVKLKTANPA